MRQGDQAQWVNKCLFKGPLKKSGIFFLSGFFFLLLPGCVNASQTVNFLPKQSPSEMIDVSAVVPLTKEFSYLIRKNSDIIPEKNAFVLGEEGKIQVSIRGGNGATLRNHRISGSIWNVHQEEVASFSGETDIFGQAIFSVKFTEQFLGVNTIEVADLTYGEALVLIKHVRFIVSETQSAKEKAEKDRRQAMTSSQAATSGVFFSDSSWPISNYSERSAIIALYRPVGAAARAGPT